jgi:SOS-response transcriptional repressor LexA
MTPLTRREREAYEFIERFFDEHAMSPTLKEICSGLKLNAASYACKLVYSLEGHGLLRRHQYQRRSIELIPRSDTPTPAMVNIGRNVLLGFTVRDFQERPELVAKRVYEAMQKNRPG